MCGIVNLDAILLVPDLLIEIGGQATAILLHQSGLLFHGGVSSKR